VWATATEIVLDAQLVEGRGELRGDVHETACVVSSGGVTVGPGGTVGPGVVLDATSGDILVGRDVHIMANAVIVGPAHVGDGSLVRAGTRVYPGTSIGPVCKVGGEISASVIQSHSNKQHEGYLGSSFVGSWVNLGAGTDTSDLRNDYSNVRVEVGGVAVDTGYQSVGAAIGDHTKTAIGTKLNTGSVVGVFCSVFPGVFPPRSLPSFSWGTEAGFVRYDLERAVDTARRVMARRGVELTPTREALVRSAYARA
jgi:UDP-N-acetylglucosamine diphosphorylase/glucosamine-1-phosphate N-acetyltransferase